MRRALVTGVGTVLGAIALWWIIPTQTKNGTLQFADLGPPDGCACAPRLSDHSDHWANCAVAFAAIEDNGAILLEGVPGSIEMDEAVRKPRKLSPAQTMLLRESVEPKCGKFEDARARDLILREGRDRANYERLYVPGSFEEALGYSSAGVALEYKLEQRAKERKREGGRDA